MTRNNHVGKNPYEKEAYRNFINQHFKFDKTVEDPEDYSKTDSSAFEKEDFNNNFGRPQKKSLTLKIKDFFTNHWVVGIGTGLICALILGSITFFVKQSVQAEKILKLEEGLEKTDIKMEKINNDLFSVKEAFNTFNITFTKDFEYIKEKLEKK